MPTRARSFGKLVLGSPTEMPSTTICPFWNASSALTHLISVDFPDPDGPQTTTTSPLATLVVQSFRAWKVGLYHLLTLLISIIGGPNCLNFTERWQCALTFAARQRKQYWKGRSRRRLQTDTSRPAGRRVAPPCWLRRENRGSTARKPARCPGTARWSASAEPAACCGRLAAARRSACSARRSGRARKRRTA